jgi:hypothetical protein
MVYLEILLLVLVTLGGLVALALVTASHPMSHLHLRHAALARLPSSAPTTVHTTAAPTTTIEAGQ